jgi:hypothetical protein
MLVEQFVNQSIELEKKSNLNFALIIPFAIFARSIEILYE